MYFRYLLCNYGEISFRVQPSLLNKPVMGEKSRASVTRMKTRERGAGLCRCLARLLATRFARHSKRIACWRAILSFQTPDMAAMLVVSTIKIISKNLHGNGI